MREQHYQSVCRQICLSDSRKRRIWEGVKEAADGRTARRKPHFTLRGAVCVCAVLLASGLTVLAAYPSYVERIAKAMNFFGGYGGEATQNQLELYAAYAGGVEHNWVSEAGQVRLEAVLYDRGYLCMPFTLYPDRPLTPGADISSEPVFQELLTQVTGEGCYFKKAGEETGNFSRFTQIDPVVREDGSLTGSFLIANPTEDGFAQGDVITLVRREEMKEGEACARVLADGEDAEGLRTFELEIDGETVTYVDLRPEDEVLAEILLETAPVPEIEISTAGIRLPYGIETDKIIISSLALYLCGTGDDTQPASKLSYNISVTLKDGSIVESGGTFLWDGRAERGSHEYNIYFSMAFADAVNLDEIAGVRITDRGEEICFIPVD